MAGIRPLSLSIHFRRAMERVFRHAPALLLAAALVIAGAMTLALTWHLTFYQDTWDYLITRRAITADTIFTPHNEHIVAIPVLIEQLFMRVFGMGTAKPEYVLLTVMLVVTAYLLAVYVKRRVGPWPALFAAVLVLCLGPAFEVLLWPFEICFIGSVLFGIAMLLVLERPSRRNDALACLFVVLSLGFSSLGVAFLVAAFVAIVLGPRERLLARAYVFVVPALLFAGWYLHWGHDAESHISLVNVLASPRYVVEGLAANVGSVVGLGPSPYGLPTNPVWGGALLILLVLALGYRHWLRKPSYEPGLWPVLAATAAYWFLAAFNQFPGREPTASRYQYAGAILLFMLLASLLRGVRVPRAAIIGGAIVTALAIGPNLVILKNAKPPLEVQSVYTRADTAALEIARNTVDPTLQLNPEIAGTPSLVNIYAGPYLEAVDEFGSPAYSVSELASAPEEGRRQADVVLANALPVTVSTRLGGSPGTNCEMIPEGGGLAAGVPLTPGAHKIVLSPGPGANIALRRFAVGEFPVKDNGIPGNSVTELQIPRDPVRRPWRLLVDADRPVQLCE
jgi:hypothetical protein